MGEIVKVTCRACGQSWQCQRGCGVGHARLKNVITYFNDRTQAEIQEWAQGEDYPLFDFDFQPAGCEKCRDIVSVPVLRLGKLEKDYIGECPKCGGVIKREKMPPTLTCPICGKQEFEIQREGLWD